MILIIVLALVALGLLFSIIRLIKGPSIADRVVSIDTINVIITGTICLMAYLFENSLYLDIAIVYGILSFLETVIISKYLEAKV